MRAFLLPWAIAVLTAGCSEVDIALFSGLAAADGGDASGTAGGTSETTASEDARPEPTCTPARTWEADFSTDPTQQDLDGDGSMDWILRSNPGGAMDPDELDGGLWLAAPNRELDTSPLHDFSSRTIIRTRMMAATDASVQLWINFDPQGDTFASVYADQPYTATEKQNFELLTKPNEPEGERLKNVRGLDHRLIESVVELVPESGEVSLWIEGRYEGTFDYLRRPIPGRGADLFATVVARGDVAQVDSIRVDACAP